MDKLSERMLEYLFRVSEREPVDKVMMAWADEVAQLEAENEKLNEELREMVLLEERRQFLLGEVLRKKRKALEAGGEDEQVK